MLRNVIVCLFILALNSIASSVVADSGETATPQEQAAPAATEGQKNTPPSESPAAATSPPVEADTRLLYSASRTVERPFDTGRAVEVVTREDLWRRNARTLPEALMEVAGVFVQQTDYGAGAPVMRGLIGKQILILVDGVKINNATYRFGPNQFLATIDLDMVERIEIIRGVGSILGSDAFGGGVINIITRKGPQQGEDAPVGGRAAFRLSSADEGATARSEVFGRTERLRYLAGGTFRTCSDVRGGSGVGKQSATGYQEMAGNLSLELYLSPTKSFSLSYLTLEQDDVPRTDRITDGTNLLFNYDPQRIHLATVGYQDLSLRGWADALRFTAFMNRQDEGNQEIRSNAPTTERFLDDRQTVFGLNAEAATAIGRHRLAYGLEFSAEEIDSQRYDLKLSTGSTSVKRGKYTDGATYRTFATYLDGRVEPSRWISVLLGGRFNHFSIAGRESTSVGDLDLSGNDSALTGSARVIAHVTQGVNISAAVTRGYRAPNLDDISVFDERGAQGTEVPNPAVRPERLVAYEAGVAVQRTKISASAFYHYGDFSDLLVRANGTFLGLAFIDANENGVRDPNESPVLQKQNLGQSAIHGFELEARYMPRSSWTLYGNLTRTVGNDTLADPDVPLPRIPPLFGTVGVLWRSSSKRHEWAELVCRFADEQKRLSPADVSDTRIGPQGTPGFAVLHWRGGLSLGRHFRSTLALENLTNKKYKLHGSGVFRPGFQGVLGIEAVF